nr:hypothetical protein [Janthinobacterium agaricidamnosum]
MHRLKTLAAHFCLSGRRFFLHFLLQQFIAKDVQVNIFVNAAQVRSEPLGKLAMIKLMVMAGFFRKRQLIRITLGNLRKRIRSEQFFTNDIEHRMHVLVGNRIICGSGKLRKNADSEH